MIDQKAPVANHYSPDHYLIFSFLSSYESFYQTPFAPSTAEPVSPLALEVAAGGTGQDVPAPPNYCCWNYYFYIDYVNTVLM